MGTGARCTDMTVPQDPAHLSWRLQESEGRASIQNLVADYCHFVDRRDAEGFGQLWAWDAEYSFPDGHGDFTGPTGVLAAYEAITTMWQRTFHWTTNLRVDFSDPDHARGRCDAFVICEHPKDGRVSLMGASYGDAYVRTSKGWRFSRRRVDRWFLTDAMALPLIRPGHSA